MPADLFRALAAGGGGPAALEVLRRVQHSKHALLLRGVLTAAVGHPQAALARGGYELLAAAERRDRGAVADVVCHPWVGAWAQRTLLALREQTPYDDAAPGVLATIAAAAAIRTGLPAEIEVPAIGDTVALPSLGTAEVPDVTVATVRSAPDRAEVTADSVRVRIPVRSGEGSSGWRPLRRLTCGICEGAEFEPLLDDASPFRMPAAPHLARLDDPGGWISPFRDAWKLLSRHHPAFATEVAALVRVVVPLAAPEDGLVSSSSPETFGAIAISEPEDACTLALTLVHETQHVKLSALLDIIQLTLPDNGTRYYAPWREDPRPVSGLLQGAYAYLVVTAFWRRQRRLSSQAQADIEFARWREAASLATGTLLGSGRLTVDGQRFVRIMEATLRTWQSEQLPLDARTSARERNDRHRALWETAHGPVRHS